MGLIFDGMEARTLEGVSLKAHDSSTGKLVPVKVSFDVLQDHGLTAAQNTAETKYDNGALELDGSVSVKTSDF